MIYFKLWVLYFLIKIRAQTCYQSHLGNGISKLENLREISQIPLQYQDFPILKSDFPHLKSNFPCTKSNSPKSAFYFLQQLSAFSNGFLIFFNGFLLSPTASEFLQRLSNFPQRLSAFREIQENLFMVRSIRNFAIRASYFLPLAPRAS